MDEQKLADEIQAKLGEDGVKRIQECATNDDVLGILSETGVELPDEMLEGVSGGWIKKLILDALKHVGY